MKAFNQLEKDREKLANLEAKYQLSLEKRNQEILSIMNEMNLGNIDGYTLIGAFLDLKSKVQKKDTICAQWAKEGKNYTRRLKRRAL